MASKPEPIPLSTALSRLVELAEFELLSPACPDPPPGWQSGLVAAVKEVKHFLAEIREPAGEFFLSAEQRPHKKNNHINQVEENQAMSHIILHDSKLNKDYKLGVSDTISRAEFTAGIEAVLSELNALVARHGPALGAKQQKELKGINAVLKQLEAMTGKDKPSPAQPSGPLFAGNQAGMAELLHKGGDFNATLAAAAAQTKDRNYNGDNKR